MQIQKKLHEKIRIGYLVNHPIIYQAPLLRRLSKEPCFDLSVIFCQDFSLNTYFDTEFQRTIAWDTPLLEGYRSEFLPEHVANWIPRCLKPVNTGLYSALTKNNLDVLWIHGWNYVTNVRAAVLGRSLGIKVLFRGESTVPLSLNEYGCAKPFFYRVLRQLADGFLAIGTLNQDFYRAIGVPDTRMALVPYAVDNAYFQSQAKAVRSRRDDLRRMLGLAPGRPVILYASKLTPRKRAMDLIHAYGKLVQREDCEPKPYLLLIGDGEMRAAIEPAAAAVAKESIRILGFKNQSELPAFYDLCDIFVLPSLAEPWGLVINEVMNFGKPVVISDQVGCGPDLVQHGLNGFIFPAGDVNALSAALYTLCVNPQLCESFGQRGLETISHWGFEQDVKGLHAAVQFLGIG